MSRRSFVAARPLKLGLDPIKIPRLSPDVGDGLFWGSSFPSLRLEMNNWHHLIHLLLIGSQLGFSLPFLWFYIHTASWHTSDVQAVEREAQVFGMRRNSHNYSHALDAIIMVSWLTPPRLAKLRNTAKQGMENVTCVTKLWTFDYLEQSYA